MGKILGLDIGITSVGYGIIDEDTYEIIKYGVRLFEEADAKNNLKRRTMRSARRMKRRKGWRIENLRFLFEKIGFGDFKNLNYGQDKNIYEARKKGLSEKLSKEELYAALLNITKHRGLDLEVVLDENNKDDKKTKIGLKNNMQELSLTNTHVVDVQLKHLKENNRIRGEKNIFKTDEYLKEVHDILLIQKKYYKELTDDAISQIEWIIKRRRHFSIGPGGKKSPTKYGRYTSPNQDKPENLIERMRGKCSVYTDELRAPKMSYSADLFNFLNDLNNLKIKSNEGYIKVTLEQKKELIENYINKFGKITINKLLKYLRTDENNVTGFRKNKKGDSIITEFKGYQKFLEIEDLDERVLLDKTKFDTLIEKLTSTSIINERINEVKKIYPFLSDSIIGKITNISGISGYHSLSLKAIYELNDEMLNSDLNQMQIITKRENYQDEMKIYEGKKEIPFDEKAILSPVAKRAHKQALKIVDTLRKEFGEFSSIVIETAREKNLEEERKKIKEIQRNAEERNEKASNELIKNNVKDKQINYKNRMKMLLYLEQEAKCVYTGNEIDIHELITNNYKYDIDHIIPYAVSFDDSFSNKVLVEKKANDIKGKRTPFAYFKSGEAYGKIKTYEDFKTMVLSNKAYKEKHNLRKKELLLEERDITKYETQKDFIERDLVDTRYATKSIMNSIQKYFKANNIDTKVFAIRGKVTNAFRKRCELKKDRDLYIHHAIDALIIACLKNQRQFKSVFDSIKFNENEYDIITGEQIVDVSLNPLNDSTTIQFIKKLGNIKGKPEDFSWKIDTKTNRQIADETIYSTRNIDGKDIVVKKYKNIYDKGGEGLKSLLDKGKSEKLLMFRNDKKTYDHIINIYNEYKNEKNPFLAYFKDHGEIRKYAKDNKGPVIKDVKYLEDSLGNHLSITHKYNKVNNKKVVLLQLTPYRTDFYISPEGLYKFVTVRRNHIKQIDGKNVIDKTLYNEMKENKGIDETYTFLFSLNRNSIVRIVEDEDKKWRFIGTNNDNTNVIEIKSINIRDIKEINIDSEQDKNNKKTKQIMLGIGKKIKLIEKYNVGPTGKYNKVEKEVLKLIF